MDHVEAEILESLCVVRPAVGSRAKPEDMTPRSIVWIKEPLPLPPEVAHRGRISRREK